MNRERWISVQQVSDTKVDGSVFKKPQIGPYYDEVNPVTEQLFRQMYYQEHYLPIIRSGVINFADTKDAYIDILNKIILNPDLFIANCEKCVKEIITYSDGRSAERAAFAVKNFFER